jgi:hypothetical protein
MSLQIQLTDQSPDEYGHVYARYRDNSGNDVNAVINVNINGMLSQEIPVVAKLSWSQLEVCKLNYSQGSNAYVKVEILSSGSCVVSMSHDLFFDNFKE